MVAYGSAAHPVSLGPFKRIVEVHWSTVRFLQISVRLARAAHSTPSNDCGGGPEVPPGDYVRFYSDQLQFRNYQNNVIVPGPDYTADLIFKNDAWASPDDPIVFTGIPDVAKLASDFGGDGNFGYGYMQYGFGTTTDLTPSTPYGVWDVPGGVEVPDILDPSGNPYFAGEPSIDIYARELSGLTCYDIGGGGGFAEFGLAAAYAPIANWDPYSSAEATYKGQIFRPVGSNLSGPGDIVGDEANGENPPDSIVSILFERVTET